MHTPYFLVFGVTGQAPVAAAVAALRLRFEGDPDVDTAPPPAFPPNLYTGGDEDEDDCDGDDDHVDGEDDGEAGWGWAEDEDLDAPVEVAGVRAAKPSVFSQLVGGAVAGLRTTRQPSARPRPRESSAAAFAQLVGGGRRPPTSTPQAQPASEQVQSALDTDAVLERLALGTPLAPAHAMFQTRLNAAAEGCMLLTGQAPTGVLASITLHSAADGTPALFIGLQQGPPWDNLGLHTGAQGHAQLEPFKKYVVF
jgi:hypothetical protein